MIKIYKKYKFKDFEGGDVYINMLLEQSIQNIGMFTDIDTNIKTYQPPLTLIDKFNMSKGVQNVSKYVSPTNTYVSATTSKLDEVIPYGLKGSPKEGTTNKIAEIVDFRGNTKLVGNIITEASESGYKYVLGGNFDVRENVYYYTNVGNGLEYVDNGSLTNVNVRTQGNNLTNSTSKAIYKEEYLMNIVDVLETKSDIFINRGHISAFEAMFKMSDINNINQLSAYGNGYFNIID